MIKRIFAGLVLAGCTLFLTGCYSQQQTISVHEDGRAEIALVLTFPKEMQDVAAAIRARAALDPRLAMLDFEDGLCAALNKVVPQSENVRFRAREIVSSESFTCRVDLAINDFPKAIEENGPIAALAGLSSVGEREYRYEMQTVPLALGEMAYRGIVERQFKEQHVTATPEQLNAIVASDKAALQAVATIMFRGARSTFTIRAPEIVKTNGDVTDDRTSVTFRTKVSDALAMVLAPDENETPYIVFRY